ncbi:MAG: GGDEF domain-containing protein [Dokdonella sp.]
MNLLNVTLDIPTLTLSRALVQVVLAGLLIYVGSRQERDDSARFWAMGLFLNGVALLFFLITPTPDWEHFITAANHLALAASGACFLVGFWHFAAQPSNRWLIALLIVIPMVGLLTWDIIWPNTRMRILFSAVGQVVFLLALQNSLKWHPRVEIAAIYRRLRVIVVAYLMVFVWSYANLAHLLPASAELSGIYHRAVFSFSSLLLALALAVGCLALQFALLAAKESDRAMTDWLTGLLNRRGFFRALREVEQRFATEASGASVIVIDIDQFKAINDRFGHSTGDRALEALAELLRAQTNNENLVARTGGEEFCIVTPGADTPAAMALAESILVACRRIDLSANDGQPVPFTISAGVCDVGVGASFDEALIRADNALYVAKREGRNRVQLCAENASTV